MLDNQLPPPAEEDAAPRPAATGLGGRRCRAKTLGGIALALCTVCVLVVIALGLLGPSSTQSVYGPAGKEPPWFWTAHPPDLLVWLLVTVVVLFGAAAVATGLVATRRGWSPRPRALLTGSALAVAAMVCVPPLGTTDPLNYAAYGRMAAVGLDPYRTTPLELALDGDPIGWLSTAEPWLTTPSVYGPVVTVTEWAAAALGGTSMLRVVFLLSVLSGAAFLAVGFLLLRLAGRDPARQVRSQLLWSLNPVLLWNLVAGAHVDVLGALAVVTALCALRRSGAAVGLALGAAAAVKLTLGVLALPFAWSLRHDRRRLASAVVTGGLVVVTGYWFAYDALRNAAQVGEDVAAGTPWMLVWRALEPMLGAGAARHALIALELVLVALLTVLFLAALPPAYDRGIVQATARPALAFAAAYLLGTAYARPWYDAVAWLLLALLPRSWFDWVLLAHTALMTLPFDPGLPHRLRPGWLNRLVEEIGFRAVPALQALLLVLVVGVCLRHVRHRLPLPSEV